MMPAALTKIQRCTLVAMFANNWVSYDAADYRTQLALMRRGLTHYMNRVGSKYGRSHWGLTEAGVAEATRIARKDGDI
jgi:hypothetical protein